jgi:hypothetical protein
MEMQSERYLLAAPRYQAGGTDFLGQFFEGAFKYRIPSSDTYQPEITSTDADSFDSEGVQTRGPSLKIDHGSLQPSLTITGDEIDTTKCSLTEKEMKQIWQR